MRTSSTVDGWVVRATSGPVPARLGGVEVAATVPGTVHTDLLDAGLVPDPYVDDGERDLAWMRRASWRYSTRVRLGRTPAPTSGSTWCSRGSTRWRPSTLGPDLVTAGIWRPVGLRAGRWRGWPRSARR